MFALVVGGTEWMVTRRQIPLSGFAMLSHVGLVLLFASWVTFSAYAAEIRNVRFGAQGNATRVVLDLDGPFEPRIFLLADPYRIVIDVDGGSWGAASDTPANGIISAYRHGNFRPGTYRLVFDLKEAATVRRSFALAPNSNFGHRYVIDVAPSTREAFLTAVAASRSARPARVVTEAPPPVAINRGRRPGEKPMIVIDAGHGGVDPGTLGILGVNEKVVTLAVARELARELRSTGRYRVRLTRDTDIYIPHRQRFGIARRYGADLFISLHADSIANPRIRGGTVYTLSERGSDREAARLARRENKSDLIAGVDLAETDDQVSGILIDLAQRETMNVSAQFAEILVPEMRREVRMLRRGHRFANLLVLKAPDVPSVLVETGYLTNKEDARFLASKAGQKKLSLAIRRGIDRYFETETAQSR